MERYSKIYKSKWQSQYSEEFKRQVCQEYLAGHESRGRIEKKYKLGNSRLTAWLKSFGLDVKKPIHLPSIPMSAHKESGFESTDGASIKLLKNS